MTTKLTLSLDSAVIAAAKTHLQTKNQSLSSLVEDYFRALLNASPSTDSPSPLVSELTGLAQTTPGQDEQKLITDYLLEKYQ